MKKENWVWMPHAAHLCVARHCRFHLATYVGKYVVSTVGEWVPDSLVQAIIYQSRKGGTLPRGDEGENKFLKDIGFQEIGAGRTYETMVFLGEKHKSDCCPWRIASGVELDTDGYSTADAAARGHMELCKKWSRA